MADKVSKTSVHYSKGKMAEHCGICVHYMPPDACEKVSGNGGPTPGRIDPKYWCRLFKKEKAHA